MSEHESEHEDPSDERTADVLGVDLVTAAFIRDLEAGEISGDVLFFDAQGAPSEPPPGFAAGLTENDLDQLS